jgi:hypothetical protein
MHDEIMRFTREGEVRDDSDFIRIKQELIKSIRDEMSDCGFVQILDLDPHWSTFYLEEHKRYSFKLSVYGIYVGGDNLCKKGISGGKLIPNS